MKNGKVPERGAIPIKLKYGPDALLGYSIDIFNKCLIERQKNLKDWNVVHLNSIYKKGDRKGCGNNKCIRVTSLVGP